MHAMRAVLVAFVLMAVSDEHRGEPAGRDVAPAAVFLRADGVPHALTVR